VPPGLTGPVGISAILHLALLALVIVAQGDPPPALPPIYRVNLVAAPPGPRAPGVVTPAASARPQDPEAPPPPRSQSTPRDMAPPRARPNQRAPVPATPSPTPTKQAPATKAPPAGGGPTGDRGADVATVKIDGIEFPFPGYLDNIVRQIALRFKPDNNNQSLRAEVRFIIRRDGSVDHIRLSTPSRDYSFNAEATGSIEAAGTARAFGPLPTQYPEDVLPVVFSFVPGIIR
jgi:protein TonB